MTTNNTQQLGNYVGGLIYNKDKISENINPDEAEGQTQIVTTDKEANVSTLFILIVWRVTSAFLSIF